MRTRWHVLRLLHNRAATITATHRYYWVADLHATTLDALAVWKDNGGRPNHHYDVQEETPWTAP